jgi:hypothetical protein
MAALALFAASALTEISQLGWPRGVFPGTFDALDLLAYASGLAVCYGIDKSWPRSSASSPVDARPPAA